jgi:hypothetical protein
MNYFLKKLIVFIVLPILILWVTEIFCFPINYFTHRNWEALLLKSKIPHYGAFLPNLNVQSVEEGDLAYSTKFAIDKKVKWKTDELGNRNEDVINEADILIIGDSFIAGSSLSQEQIFSNQLFKEYHGKLKIYNLAPSTFSYWVRLIEQGIIKKPKCLIFSCVERIIPEVFVPKNNYNSYREKIKNKIRETKVASVADRFSRFYLLKWLAARIRNDKGAGIQSEVNNKMFFLQGNSVINRNKEDVYKIVEAVESYKKYCEGIGVDFLFLPMPNKESVYYDLVPLSQQPDFLFKLDTLLIQRKVETVNTLLLYNKNKRNDKFLYQLDDSHWNQYGVEIVAKAVKEKLGQI